MRGYTSKCLGFIDAVQVFWRGDNRLQASGESRVVIIRKHDQFSYSFKRVHTCLSIASLKDGHLTYREMNHDTQPMNIWRTSDVATLRAPSVGGEREREADMKTGYGYDTKTASSKWPKATKLMVCITPYVTQTKPQTTERAANPTANVHRIRYDPHPHTQQPTHTPLSREQQKHAGSVTVHLSKISGTVKSPPTNHS